MFVSAGFDGKIKTVIDKGSANIQISRITDNSELNILNGSLILKLSEACQEYTEFRIKTLDWEIPDNFKMTVRNCDGVVHLIPDLHDDNIVKVNCMNGSVDVESASWQDMIKMKLKNKNSHWHSVLLVNDLLCYQRHIFHHFSCILHCSNLTDILFFIINMFKVDISHKMIFQLEIGELTLGFWYKWVKTANENVGQINVYNSQLFFQSTKLFSH